MEYYIGTKITKAMPMTRQVYNDYRGWKLPDDENGADDGYLVEYTDGGAANHPNHAGYISWSPKDVHDRAYVAVGDLDNFPPHQQRVIAEKAELDSKISRLETFLVSDAYCKVPGDERLRLFHQAAVMTKYSEILAARIAAFEVPA
jgi:hypothetical protein